MLSLVFIASSIAVSAPSVHAEDTFTGITGRGERAQVKHLIPHEVGEENYVEKYTFVAQLKPASGDAEGEPGRLYFSISVTNIGAGDHKVTAKGSIKLGDQQYKWNVKLDSDEWKRSKNTLNIRAGGVQLKGTLKELTLTAKRQGGEMSIKWRPIAKAWRPAKGGVQFSGKESAEFTILPMNQIQGAFTPKGGAEVAVQGVGWATHSWSHLGPHEWQKYSLQTRFFDADQQRALFLRTIKTGGDYPSKTLHYAILVERDKVLFEGHQFKVKSLKSYTDRKHDNRYKFSTEMRLTGTDARNGSKLQVYMKTNKLHYRRDPLAKLSWVKRKAVQLVTQPMIYAYQVDYEVKLSGSSALTWRGQDGRYEAYFLNK